MENRGLVTITRGWAPINQILVFVDAQAGIDGSAIRPGQWLQAARYSGRYEEHHEILPRTQSDQRPAPTPRSD